MILILLKDLILYLVSEFKLINIYILKLILNKIFLTKYNENG